MPRTKVLWLNAAMGQKLPPFVRATLGAPSDMAAHFMECGALNTNLSLSPGGRLVITDDLLDGTVVDAAALSMAAIVARDGQVARAALIPLGVAASRMTGSERNKYERLFALIEDSAFAPQVRDSAEALLRAGFREARIRELAAELGGSVGPARARYRAFLDVIRQLTEGQISEVAFLDEFLDFTREVAGKLDFGIYAMCIDRLFVSEQIALSVKAAMLREVLTYPPLIRRELITTLLASPQAVPELRQLARTELTARLDPRQQTEIRLYTLLKRSWQARRPTSDSIAT
ncbi:hypothetical protein [Magnetospirillum molischianum]|uniref:hypothetical protein n=1 Tax=Magnetospirillum molischianum TaxID=1083 RepID=UPI001F360AC0|nr:hypothetical protein [Magnetospirillum molischianum]